MVTFSKDVELCRSYQAWMRAKWAEMDRNPELHSITDDDGNWTARHNDTQAECPYCGYIFKR